MYSNDTGFEEFSLKIVIFPKIYIRINYTTTTSINFFGGLIVNITSEIFTDKLEKIEIMYLNCDLRTSLSFFPI